MATSKKPQTHGDMVEWFTVSYRSIYLVLGLLLAVGGIVYFLFFRQEAPPQAETPPAPSITAARFRSPQGVALLGDALYVADTENHLVRRLDLARGLVETVAGTGAQALGPSGAGRAGEVALNSPWDLVALEGRSEAGERARPFLFVAMAGAHQVWLLDLDDEVDGLGHFEALARNAERLVDGRKVLLVELDVDDRPDDLNHPADIPVRCHGV